MPVDPFVAGPVTGECAAVEIGIPEKLLRALIGDKQLPVDSPVEQAVRAARALVLALARPRYSLAIYPARSDGHVAVVGEQTFFTGTLARALAAAEQAGALLVSLGAALTEQISADAGERKVLEAFLLDAAGSAMVEALADRIHTDLAAYAQRHDLEVGHRYSPGYCDWDVREQAKLFTLLDADAVGVRLLPSMLMSPRKSISAVIPLGRDTSTIADPACYGCDERNCPYRRFEPYQPGGI